MASNKGRQRERAQAEPFRRRRQRAHSSPTLPRLEPLEDRLLLSSYLVNSPGDAPEGDQPAVHKCDTGFTDGKGVYHATGECTLRAAIMQINFDKEAKNKIGFAAGFAIGSASLPELKYQVDIDGGGTVTIGGSGLSLASGADGSTVKGLTITGGPSGIFVGSGKNVIQDNVLVGNFVGLIVGGPDNTVKNNVISANKTDGIHILGPGTMGNKVQGNKIGTDPSGKFAMGNGGSGVSIFAGANKNLLGAEGKDTAADAAQRNIISGNAFNGVRITDAKTDFNVVAGNYIGTDVTGATAKDAVGKFLGNGAEGVSISRGAQNNQIGTNGLEAKTVDMRNVISANKSHGVLITGKGTDFNVVAGNYIGTDKTGFLAKDGPGPGGTPLGNGFPGMTGTGVTISAGAKSNRIGTNNDGKGDDDELNLISANAADGVAITGAGTDGNIVAGNYIGTDATGTLATDKFGNSFGGSGNGVMISAGAQKNQIGIVGSASFAPLPPCAKGNLFANLKLAGVAIAGVGSDENVVVGNYIGTNKTGTKALPAGAGVAISAGAQFNRIGTNGDGICDDGERNLISGNKADGVVITGAGTNGNLVAGNYIGTDVTGALPLANGANGVLVSAGAQENFVGVDERDLNPTADGNVIAGNTGDGVNVTDKGTDLNMIAGNYIGTDAKGTSALPNGKAGVVITGGAQKNRVGVHGNNKADVAERNVISGNTTDGVVITGTGSDFNVVRGNYIGTDVTGADLGGLLANSQNGVQISGGAQNNYIGTNGLDANNTGERNLISANAQDGVLITGFGTDYNVVAGNYIGTEVSGFFARGNGRAGVAITGGAQNNRIGSDGNGKGDVYKPNVISGNTTDGVRITGGTNSNVVTGNYIGVGATGILALSNRRHGVAMLKTGIITDPDYDATGSPQFNQIGIFNLDPFTTPVVVPNVISHNGKIGVAIFGPGTNANVVAGNKIGTDLTGTFGLGNGSWGVAIYKGAASNIIGINPVGTNNPAEGNLISDNGQIGPADERDGVTIFGFGSDSNVVAGNLIGTDVTGKLAMGNGGAGVAIGASAKSNLVGTSGMEMLPANMRNIISANTGIGVHIALSGSDGNVVAGNFIGTDVTGTLTTDKNGKSLGNGAEGVMISKGAMSNRIGTNGDGFGDAAELNLISGNKTDGVVIVDAGTDKNVVAGNYVGTDVTGTLALGNGGSGVVISKGAKLNQVGTSGKEAMPANMSNVISSNTGAGVRITDPGTDGNVVAGNNIGTDVTGTLIIDSAGKSLGNGAQGVMVSKGASSNWIGTNADGFGDALESNIIAGNNADGVTLSDTGTSKNVVAGNFIGTDPTGTLALGNAGHGVQVSKGASLNTIGGLVAVAANTIAFNGGAGVAVVDDDSTGNGILSNAIFSNTALGIDLGADGVTPNHPDNPALGPNNWQNYPVLASAVTTGGMTTITGTLHSTPSTTFRIEFFSNAVADPSGFGQGSTFLGFITVTTDDMGDAIVLASFPAVPVGFFITANATDAGNNTSEFSADEPVTSSSAAPSGSRTPEDAKLTAVLAVFGGSSRDNVETSLLSTDLRTTPVPQIEPAKSPRFPRRSLDIFFSSLVSGEFRLISSGDQRFVPGLAQDSLSETELSLL